MSDEPITIEQELRTLDWLSRQPEFKVDIVKRIRAAASDLYIHSRCIVDAHALAAEMVDGYHKTETLLRALNDIRILAESLAPYPKIANRAAEAIAAFESEGIENGDYR